MPVVKSANEIDVHVGLRLRRRREALGVSQGRLGRELGLTFSQIQKYEKGTNRIGAGRLYQIATFLDVAPSYFFVGLGNDGAADGGENAALTGEMMTLRDAFASIDDPETRASVLALVTSLAEGRRTIAKV